MKIAVMSAWNVDSGVTIHAEPIVKAWIGMGIDVRVLTFLRDDFHGTAIIGEDEAFVTRCFGTSGKTNFLDSRPLLKEDYDVLVVEDLKMLPMENLSKIFHHVRRKAKAVIHVLHENTILGDPPPQPPTFYSFHWDAVVTIEPTQTWFAKKRYGNIVHELPFPCFPIREQPKDVSALRKKLKLPVDKKLVLLYARGGYQPYLPGLPNSRLENVHFLVLTGRNYNWVHPQTEIRKTPPLTNAELDEYALAADALVLHKLSSQPFPVAVTSTAAYQLLGTLKPILAPRISDYFEAFEGKILKYTDRNDYVTLLLDALSQGPKTKKTRKSAETFLKERSPERVASQFLEIIEKVMRK